MPVRTESSYACVRKRSAVEAHRSMGSIGACDALVSRRAWATVKAPDGSLLTFFMMPALRLEKVMWRRDLSWMNLISIFLLSRPGLSSSSSSSSAAGRGRFVPRLGSAWARAPLPLLATSSLAVGDCCCSWSVISLVMVVAGGGASGDDLGILYCDFPFGWRRASQW